MIAGREYIGLLIAAARRRVKRALEIRLEEHGLDPQQLWFLLALCEAPGLSATGLAERQRTDLPTVSRVAARLARRGLARVERDDDDRRRARIVLTAAGTRLAKKLQPLAGEVRAAVVHGFTAAEEDALRSALRRVIANLDRLIAQPVSKAPRARRARG